MAEQFSPTVTPQGTGSAQIQAAQAETAVAKRPWDLFQNVVTQIPQATGVLLEQHKKDEAFADSIKGGDAAASVLADVSQMSAQERANELGSIRSIIAGGDSNQSDAYNKALISATNGAYFSAQENAQAETNISNVGTALKGMVIPDTLPKDYDITSGIKWIADNNNVDVNKVRDMYLSQQTDYFSGQIGLANTPSEVAIIQEQMAENKKRLGGSNFYGTKSTNFKQALKTSETNMKNALVAKNKQWTEEAKGRIAMSIGDLSSVTTSYREPLSAQMITDMKMAYPNPIEFNNQLNKYNKAQTEASQGRTFLAGTKPGEAHAPLPEGSTLKAEWTKKAEKGLITSFNGSNFQEFVDIATYDGDYAKGGGSQLMTLYNAIDNPVALGAFIDKVEVLSVHENGAAAVRAMMGDGAYSSMLAVQYMVESGQAVDVKGARAEMSRASAQIAKVKMTPEMNAEMNQYAHKMGTQGSAFVATFTNLHKINPEAASDKLPKLAQFFAEQTIKDGDVIIDNSMLSIADTISLDPEGTIVRLRRDMTRELGTTPNRIINVGDTVIGIDTLTGAMNIQSVTKAANAENRAIEIRKKLEAEDLAKGQGTILGDAGEAISTFGSVLVGQVPAAFGAAGEGISDAVGNIFNKLGAHMWKNMTGTHAIIDAIDEFFPDAPPEAIKDEFDLYIDSLVTENPTDGVPNNTMTKYDGEVLAATLQANKKKVDMAKYLQSVLEAKTLDDIDFQQGATNEVTTTIASEPTINKELP